MNPSVKDREVKDREEKIVSLFISTVSPNV